MAKTSGKDTRAKRRDAEGWALYGPAVLLTVAGFVLAYQFVEPAPPREIVMATGGESGAYYLYGQRFSEVLAREGITLEVRPSSGSVENLAKLNDKGSDIQVAFVQGGIGDPEEGTGLRSLASLYYEPLWGFTRDPGPVNHLKALAGRRVAAGAEGSGTRAVLRRLLADNGIAEDNIELLTLGGEDAASALTGGSVDAAFFVASPEAPVVARLLHDESLEIVGLARTAAYARIHRYLSEVRLPEGVIDLAANIPGRDVMLLAPTANLVAKEDLHPAIAALLLQAAAEIDAGSGLLAAPGTFPSDRFLDFPLSEAAERYFAHGPPFLQRYLPFWAANLIDRLKILLLPLLTLMIPLLRIVPPTYRWRVRSKIYRWYKELEEVDDRLRGVGSAGSLQSLGGELDRIEEEVCQVSVPLSYADQLYHLRLHIDYLRGRLQKTAAQRRL